MNSLTEAVLDTVIGFLIIAACIANLINFTAYIMYEEKFGFGTLQEKSSDNIEYTINKDKFVGYSQMQYYMLPIVDTENKRTIYELDGENTYTYSAETGTNMINLYHKILPVLENTENKGELDRLKYSISMDVNGTLQFQKEENH